MTLATVAIPTLNGGPLFREVLEAVFAQETSFPFEVLVIDSGSRDSTLDIVRATPARLHEIPQSSFGHGRTRNLAVEMASGEFVAFLTQDATPATTSWLAHLVGGFDAADNVGAVYGPHLVRPDADPKTRRDQTGFFEGMGPPDRPTVHRAGDLYFFSDVNGCLRKPVWREVPYRDLPYAEDQAMGKDLLAAGYAKVYEPRAAVIHSHSYPPMQYLRRMFDEWSGLKRATGEEYPPTIREAVREAYRVSRMDAGYIRRLPDPLPSKVRWIALALWMSGARQLTQYLVQRGVPDWLGSRLSHEAHIKQRAPRH